MLSFTVLRSAEDGNEKDELKGSCTACIALIDPIEVRSLCFQSALLTSSVVQ